MSGFFFPFLKTSVHSFFIKGETIELLLLPFFTFLLGLILSFFVLWLFPKINLLDNPKAYGHNRPPIPLPGGIAPVLAFSCSLLLLLFFAPFDTKVFALLCAVVLLTIISFIDDRKHLSPLIRLLVHFVVAAIVVAAGIKIEYVSNPFGGETFVLSTIFIALPAIITTIWLVGFANVLNWLDGVPGLSAASAAAAGIFLGMLSITPEVNQPNIALLSFVFAAAALSFVFFNIAPPKMLLGDTGAMVFGFVIAALSVFSGGKMATVFIILALPMLDAFSVISRRIFAGKNPLKGKDNLHLHDRLVQVGWSRRQVLSFFLTLSLFLGWLSLQLETKGKIILIISVGIIFLFFSSVLDRKIQKKNS